MFVAVLPRVQRTARLHGGGSRLSSEARWCLSVVPVVEGQIVAPPGFSAGGAVRRFASAGAGLAAEAMCTAGLHHF